MISFRLPAELEIKLNSVARAEGCSRSEIVKKSIAEYVEKRNLTAYELGKDLFGREGSGRGDLSSNRKAHLNNLLKRKHARR